MAFRLAIPTAARIGWIGTGVMGSSMCRKGMGFALGESKRSGMAAAERTR